MPEATEPGAPDPGPGAVPGRRVSARQPLMVVAVVAVVFLGIGLRQAWVDAPTYDEPVYVSAGVTALVHHDLRLNPEHPPLAKVVAALPVLLAHPVVPEGAAWRHADEYTYAVVFTQAQWRDGSLRRIMFLARLAPLLESVATALVLAVLATRLFGRAAGALAGALWLADPFVLGMGHLDGVDIPLALATALTSWALLEAVRSPTRRRLVALGAACAGAVLVKDTGIVVAVTAGAVVVWSGRGRGAGRALARLVPVAVTAWLAVLLCYAAIDPASLWPYLVVPEPFLTGLRYLVSHDTAGSPAYLVGNYWSGGQWWYWPVSLVVKVPLVTVAVLVAGPVGLAGVGRVVRREAVATVVVPAAVLAAFTLVSPKDVGARYLLPVVALWLVVAAPGVVRVLRGLAHLLHLPPRPALAGMLALLVVLAGAGLASGITGPSAIAWVNPPFTPGYQAASNANLDWGQAFYDLRTWSAGKHPLVAYFGQGLGVADIPGARPLLTPDGSGLAVAPADVRGWVAVSATDLTSDDEGPLSWLRAYCPVGTLGGSILLYRFASPPSGAPGPVVPAAPCDTPVSTRSGAVDR